MKLLEVGADEAERWERKKKRKDPDTGFAGEYFNTLFICGNDYFDDIIYVRFFNTRISI